MVGDIRAFKKTGFLIHQPFPGDDFPGFSPFLLLSRLKPVRLGPNRTGDTPSRPCQNFRAIDCILSKQLGVGVLQNVPICWVQIVSDKWRRIPKSYVPEYQDRYLPGQIGNSATFGSKSVYCGRTGPCKLPLPQGPRGVPRPRTAKSFW